MNPSTRRTAARRGAFAAPLLLALALLLSACGGGGGGGQASGVASLGSTTTSAAPAGTDGTGASKGASYSQCMRQNGVSQFPDPDSSGRVMVQGGADSGLDPESPTFQAAEKACRSLAPSGAAGKQQGGGQDAILKYSACMRQNGVADFPDPEMSGGRVQMRMPTSIDPESPAFQAAEKACKDYAPNGTANSGSK